MRNSHHEVCVDCVNDREQGYVNQRRNLAVQAIVKRARSSWLPDTEMAHFCQSGENPIMCTIKATVVAVYPANPMEFIVRKTFFILLSLCLLAAINGSPAHAQLFITTDTTINWNVGDGEYVFVGVDKWPPDQTINTSPNVSIVSGANIYALASFNSSRINISGGTIGPLLAKNSSTINVSGGNLDRLYANDSCTINMSGGEAVAYWAAQNSTLNFYGHNLSIWR
jgi:hypothetical protein